MMKKKFLIMVLGTLFIVPCTLCANKEVEIPLMEVIEMTMIEGDNPFDNPEKEGNVPTRPTSFRATLDGNILTVSIEDSSITSAHLRVFKQSTTVVDKIFFDETSENLSNGSYLLEIETTTGSLVGQFDVQ